GGQPRGVQGGRTGLSAGLLLPQPVVDQSQPRRRLRGNGCPWSDDSYQPGGGSGDGAAVVPPDRQQRPDHALHHSGHGGAGGSVALGWLSAVGARGAGDGLPLATVHYAVAPARGENAARGLALIGSRLFIMPTRSQRAVTR